MNMLMKPFSYNSKLSSPYVGIDNKNPGLDHYLIGKSLDLLNCLNDCGRVIISGVR